MEQAVDGFAVHGLEQVEMNAGFRGMAAVFVLAVPADGYQGGSLSASCSRSRRATS